MIEEQPEVITSVSSWEDGETPPLWHYWAVNAKLEIVLIYVFGWEDPTFFVLKNPTAIMEKWALWRVLDYVMIKGAENWEQACEMGEAAWRASIEKSIERLRLNDKPQH